MTAETEQDRLARQNGLFVETVADIIETGAASSTQPSPAGSSGQPPQVAASGTFTMPVLPGYPVEWPGEGVFFGMSDEDYHALPAFSNSGFKKFACSPMAFWATTPWLNPEWAEMKAEQEAKREKDKATHFEDGHAFECRLFEGREAFYQRFGVALDKRDYPNALVTMDDIKAAFPEGVKPKGTTKRAVFDQLRELNATVELWDDLLAEHAKANESKYLMSARAFRQMEFGALVIERDPEIGPIIKTGQPQVVILWIDKATGIPMKMKADLLKVKMIVDAKTLFNRNEINIDRAVANEITNRKYAFQAVQYAEGAAAGREIVREHGARAVFSWENEAVPPGKHAERVEWALKWASHRKRDEFMFLFFMKGWAPVARGVMWPYGGTHTMIARDTIASARKRFRLFAETAGTEPWIDTRPVYDLADEDLRDYASEI